MSIRNSKKRIFEEFSSLKARRLQKNGWSSLIYTIILQASLVTDGHGWHFVIATLRPFHYIFASNWNGCLTSATRLGYF